MARFFTWLWCWFALGRKPKPLHVPKWGRWITCDPVLDKSVANYYTIYNVQKRICMCCGVVEIKRTKVNSRHISFSTAEQESVFADLEKYRRKCEVDALAGE